MKISLLILTIFCSACATNRTKQILLTTIAASTAGTIGALTSPKDESSMAHFLMWGGTAGTVAAISSMYIYENEKVQKDLELQIQSLRSDLDTQNKKGEPKLEQITIDPIYKSIPKNMNQMIQPGQWKLYKLDRWVEDGDNRLIHQDKLLEIIPSQLIPKSNLSTNNQQED